MGIKWPTIAVSIEAMIVVPKEREFFSMATSYK